MERPSPNEAEYSPALRSINRMIEMAREILRDADNEATEREAYLMEQEWLQHREEYLQRLYGLRRKVDGKD